MTIMPNFKEPEEEEEVLSRNRRNFTGICDTMDPRNYC